MGDLNAYVDKLWDGSSARTRADYGREFYNAYLNSGFPDSPKIYKVIDALEHAVLAKCPQKYYRRGPGSTVLPWLTWFSPWMYDWTPRWLMSRFTFYTGAKPQMLQ